MCYEDESKVPLVALLLDRGADPNLYREGDDEYARKYLTALHLANSASVADVLLNHGALIDANPRGYGTPLLMNECYNGPERYDKVSELLIRRGADVNASHWNILSPFAVTYRNWKLQTAKLMLAKGARLDATDIMGRIPLFGAISASKSDIVDLLLSLGANASHEDRRGCAGLHYAARIRDSDLVEKFLKLGADVNKVDCNGWSPLHWAMASSMKSAKAIKILLKAGANTELKDMSGKTPLDHKKAFCSTPILNARTASVALTLFNMSEDHLNEGITPLRQHDSAQVDVPDLPDSDDNSPRNQLLRYCDGCQIVGTFTLQPLISRNANASC